MELKALLKESCVCVGGGGVHFNTLCTHNFWIYLRTLKMPESVLSLRIKLVSIQYVDT
jgi:hypothetical protein